MRPSRPRCRPVLAAIPLVLPLVLPFLVSPAPAGAAIEYAPARRDFICGRLARDVAAIDFDEDGKLDVACARLSLDLTSPGQVTLLRGDGAGHFALFADLPSTAIPTSILAADVNEDGHADLVVSGFIDSTIGLYLGDGHGGFIFSTFPFPGANPFHVNAADLDGDGHLDLVAGGTGTGDGEIEILRGDGAGSFTLVRTLAGGVVPQHIAIGDLDADGDLDLAIADSDASGEVILYLGDGRGEFAPGGLVDVAGRRPVWIDIRAARTGEPPYLAVATYGDELLGDGAEVYRWVPAEGRLERVARFDLPGASAISIVLLPYRFVHDPAKTPAVPWTPGLALATQSFSELMLWRTLDEEPLVLPTQDSPTAVRFGDWTSDGIPDIVLPGFNTESISLYIGEGRARMESAPRLELPGAPNVLKPLFLDADARVDLAVLRPRARAVTVLLGRGAPGDFDAKDIGEPLPDVPGGLAVFDLGDDGAPDFAVGRQLGGDELWILRSSAGYAREVVEAPGSGPTAVEAADLDGDGADDLAETLYLSRKLAVHFGDGAGGFAAAVPIRVAAGPVALAVADLDGNGLGDLAAACDIDGDSLAVVRQGPARRFTAAPALPVRVGRVDGVAAGRFEGDDEHLDLAVGGFLGLETFAGDGNGSFVSTRFIPTAAEFKAIHAADLDGDGLDELVGADRVGNAMVILAGTAGGVAYPPLTFGVERSPFEFAAVDLDADDRLDLAVVARDRLSVLLSGGAGADADRGTSVMSWRAGAAPLAPRVVPSPNPFRGATALAVDLPGPSPAALRIYDAGGRLLATPFSGLLPAGRSVLAWSPEVPLTRGVYFYRLDLGGRPGPSGKLVRR